jgi:hypothetical protein
MFDYATIPDVILHISYTARDNDALRTTVETAIVDSLTAYASTTGMHKILSLRRDFPNAFNQFMNADAAIQQTKFELSKQHFPYFLYTRTLTVTGASLFIQPAGPAALDTIGLKIAVNGAQAASWSIPPNTSLRTADASVSGPALTTWSMRVTDGHLGIGSIQDILLLIKYSVT